MTSESPEHFVTLFDSNFLPMGLALRASLRRHHGNFRLWILCMDAKAEELLGKLAMPDVTLIPLRTMETEALLEAKKDRGRGEYCWTLTPFTFQAVFDRDPSVKRVTYLDSDLFLFADPRVLLDELDAAGKQVLYTDHAYSPRYEQASKNGRYCVQFLTIANTEGGRKVMRWWQERCLEWCYDRVEPGRFGDQKYLEQWEILFLAESHVVRQTDKTLAPWNVEHAFARNGFYPPVFYHFHSLRIVSPRKVRMFTDYVVGPHADRIYREYVEALRSSLKSLHGLGFPTPTLPNAKRKYPILSRLKKVYYSRTERYWPL